MYYEVHGDRGTPLVMLHGAFSAIATSFGSILPGLAATRTVFGFELQGHGRTADIDRPLSVAAFADDVAKAIKALGYERVDVLGYSLGCAVAINLINTHPELVRRFGIDLGNLPTRRYTARSDGWAGRDETRNDAWFDVARGVFAHRAAAGRLLPALREEDGNGSGAQGLAARIDLRHQIPDASDRWRRGPRPAHVPSELAIITGASHVTVVFQGDVLVKVISRLLDKDLEPEVIELQDSFTASY